MNDFTANSETKSFFGKKKKGEGGGTSLPFKSGVRKGAY